MASAAITTTGTTTPTAAFAPVDRPWLGVGLAVDKVPPARVVLAEMSEDCHLSSIIGAKTSYESTVTTDWLSVIVAGIVISVDVEPDSQGRNGKVAKSPATLSHVCHWFVLSLFTEQV